MSIGVSGIDRVYNRNSCRRIWQEEETYRLVKLGTSLAARSLSLLLVLLAPAGQLSLDLCGGLVDVGCVKGMMV